MRRGRKKVKLFIVLALVTCIPVAFTFSYYYSLSIADFLSFQLKLEAPDQINLPAASDDKLKVFGLTRFNYLFCLDNNTFEQLHVISFQTSPLDLTAFILRC